MAPHEVNHVVSSPALSVRRRDGYTIVAISGELDIASVPALRERLLGLLRPDASRIVIDLSRVTFCDASGLAMLVGASRRADLLDGVLRLAAPTPLVATVLRLTGLDSRFEIFATVAEAIGAPVHPDVSDAGVPKPRARRLAPCWSTDIIASVDSAPWLRLRLVRLRASLQPPVAGSSIAIPASLSPSSHVTLISTPVSQELSPVTAAARMQASASAATWLGC
jgi:anti-sigma B factor antagonist